VLSASPLGWTLVVSSVLMSLLLALLVVSNRVATKITR
jgi:uncharacterized integral membrane protein